MENNDPYSTKQQTGSSEKPVLNAGHTAIAQIRCALYHQEQFIKDNCCYKNDDTLFCSGVNPNLTKRKTVCENKNGNDPEQNKVQVSDHNRSKSKSHMTNGRYYGCSLQQ